MLQINQEYKDLYNSYGGKSIRLVFLKDTYRALYPSETIFPSEKLYPSEMDKDSIAFEITDELIHTDTLTTSESLCSDENLNFGACESAQMEIVVSNPPQNIAGMEFILIESFFDYEMIRGIYTVDSTPREDDKNTRKIIAYDRMNRFNADVAGWYEAEEFPMTLREFRKSLCDFVGVPEAPNTSLINDDLTIEKTLDVQSLSGRDVLRYICQINGVFGNINLNGELQYIQIPKKHEISDTIDRYKSVTSEEYSVPDIDTIKIQKQEGDIGGISSGGDDMNVYIIEGNPLVYGKTTSEMNEIANKILSVVSDLEYTPAEIEGNGAPWYEMGDRIRVKTSDGDVDTIIMSRTSTGIQGPMDTIISTGTQELKRVFRIESQIIETKGLVAILKREVSEVSNDLTNLEEETNSKFTQTASQIALKVSKGDVTEELNSELTITGNAINLTTGHFTINAKNISVDQNGNARFSGSINVADKFTVDSNGYVKANGVELMGMSKSSQIQCLFVNCTGTVAGEYLDIRGGGDISGSVQIDELYVNDAYGSFHGTFNEYSDRRIKKDVKTIDHKESINIIKKLHPVSFRYTKDEKKSMGFIAQEVESICTEEGIELPLYEMQNGAYMIKYTNYIPILVSAIQKLTERVERQDKIIAKMEEILGLGEVKNQSEPPGGEKK